MFQDKDYPYLDFSYCHEKYVDPVIVNVLKEQGQWVTKVRVACLFVSGVEDSGGGVVDMVGLFTCFVCSANSQEVCVDVQCGWGCGWCDGVGLCWVAGVMV